MKYKYICTAIVISVFNSFSYAQNIDVDKAFDHAAKQTSIMLLEVEKAKDPEKPELVSPRTLDSGELKLVTSRDWTSGFFPGVLWFLSEYTGSNEWQKQAKEFTAEIEKEKTNGLTHDMGFKIYCSVGNAYRLTNDAHYKDVIIESARTLSTRFNPKTGVMRSWDHSGDKWINPVIIDNMMNLELLFAATRLTGDSTFYKIAVSHANTTMRNHFRPDYSSYHVLDYDPQTGEVLKKNTHQGYFHESSWSRGQAWALYGYTMCFRETKNREYLKLAENIASFILKHKRLPKDMVPYSDFDAPNIPNEARDASAAAVIASGLYELSIYSKQGKRLRKAADKIMKSLTTKYTAAPGQAKGFILLHSTGAAPSKSEVDVPLSYADYYYLEALLRKKNLEEGKPVVQI